MTFKDWAKQNGIAPRSHDWSVAWAAWQAAIKAVVDLADKKKGKANEGK